MKKYIILSLLLILTFTSNTVNSFSKDKVDIAIEKMCIFVDDWKITNDYLIELLNKLKIKYKNKTWINELIDYAVLWVNNSCWNKNQVFYPKWIYVSAWPTNERNYSVKEELLKYDYVSWILLRISWRDLEKRKWEYDFSLIDYQIKLAKKYNKKITLSIIVETPDWFKNTANTYYYKVWNESKDMAIPWNEDFLNEYWKLIKKLAEKYNSEESIWLIQVWNSSFNGIEMQFFRDINESDINYTNEKIIKSWETILSTFNKYFSNKLIVNDFHPILWNEEPSIEIYNFANTSFWKKYWVSMWWWTKQNTEFYSVQNDILNQSIKKSFWWVQFAQSWTKNPDKLSENWFSWLIDFTLEKWICYFEIWEIDIKNKDFIKDFEKINNKCIKK